ncbi:cAMP-dependent protein kinase [Aureococcus anophagefferens]|nr:cAMP-dependent protein kinase [Aureococcus anophagefferens]
MATVSYSVPPDRVEAAGDLSGALWFVGFAAGAGGGGVRAAGAAEPLRQAPEEAGRRRRRPPRAAACRRRSSRISPPRRSGAARCYVAADAADCDDAFRGGPPRTVFAPAAGVAAASTPGWEAVRTQDDLGDLTAALGLADAGFGAGGAVAREDLAEVVLQSALRAPRDGGDVTIYYAPGGALRHDRHPASRHGRVALRGVLGACAAAAVRVPTPAGGRRAAIALVLRVNPATRAEALFIKRASRAGDPWAATSRCPAAAENPATPGDGGGGANASSVAGNGRAAARERAAGGRAGRARAVRARAAAGRAAAPPVPPPLPAPLHALPAKALEKACCQFQLSGRKRGALEALCDASGVAAEGGPGGKKRGSSSPRCCRASQRRARRDAAAGDGSAGSSPAPGGGAPAAAGRGPEAMSEFKALSRSFSRNALKKMGLGSAPATAELGRRESRRKSQDGRENRAARPHAIADADATALDEHFNSALFKDMEHDQRVDVMLAMDKMSVRAGQDLIRQGEPGNAFYVIEKGEFDIVIDGCRVTTFRRGGSFGEVALIREQPRAATVTAITSAVCWRLERSLFRKYVANTAASTIDQIVRDFRQAQLLRICREGRVRCSNIGKVSRRDSQSTSRAGEKPAYVDLGKGAHFGERALLRDEMRACDVIALEPTACYVVSRADFNAMLGSMTEAMERCLALRVIMSMKRAAAPRKSRARRARPRTRADLVSAEEDGRASSARRALDARVLFPVARRRFLAPQVRRDRGAASALREPDVFEQLERKIYKAGDCLSPNVASLKKVVVVASGVVDVRGGAPGLRQLAGLFLGRRVLRTGDLLGWQALSDEPADAASPAERATKAAQSLFWRCVRRRTSSATSSTRPSCSRSGAGAAGAGGARGRARTARTTPTSTTSTCGGRFGAARSGVKLCSYTPPFGEPKVYALKMLVKKTMVEMKQTHAVLYERKILNQLRHPFILRLHTTYQSRDACYFLLELVQGGELFSRLTTFPDGDFPAEETRFYSAATLLAMEYVHSQNMVYRDLKPENILIDTAGYVRVVDFGFAKRLAGEQPTFTIVGTPEYRADPFDTSCFDEYDEAMDIPTFAGDQHAFTEFADGTIDDSHLVHNVQQQLLPTVH